MTEPGRIFVWPSHLSPLVLWQSVGWAPRLITTSASLLLVPCFEAKVCYHHREPGLSVWDFLLSGQPQRPMRICRASPEKHIRDLQGMIYARHGKGTKWLSPPPDDGCFPFGTPGTPPSRTTREPPACLVRKWVWFEQPYGLGNPT